MILRNKITLVQRGGVSVNIVDVCLISAIIISVGYLIWLGVKQHKEDKRIENTPIDIYKYKYNVYLSDGSCYEKLANLYVVYDFDDFVKWDILYKNNLRINKTLVLNTEQIVKVELVDRIHKRIKPILNKFGIDRVYTDKEVKEREIIN